MAFAHRRFAIIDLSDAGRQPMLPADGQIGLVFNGCIHNFLDLRGELEALGYRFQSRSDTEVLLAGYQKWGIDQLAARHVCFSPSGTNCAASCFWCEID